MSKHFYKYLAKKIEEYFQSVVLSPGEKYHIQFEREEQVASLVEQLAELQSVRSFVYETTGGQFYQTISLNLQGIKLIIASTLDGTTPDFLTTLRNKVGTKEAPFYDAAILLVHHSNLDSLIHGMTSFAKEGMPFHLGTVEKDLIYQLTESKMSDSEQRVLQFVMKMKRQEQTFHEQITLFDFADILEVLEKQQLTAGDYNNFGLFYDNELQMTHLNDRDFENRLSANHELYNKVDTIHKNGNSEQDLDKWFDDKGVDLLGESQKWHTADFADVWLSSQKKKEDKGLEYVESNKKLTFEGEHFWERPDGDSKTKQRIRNIIVFNPNQHKKLTLEFSFSDFLKNQYLKLPRRKTNSKVEATGKKIRVQLHHEQGKTNFFKFEYKTETSNKFEFHIASVECDEKFLSHYQTAYKVVTKGDGYILILSEDEKWVFNEQSEQQVVAQLTGNQADDRFTVQSEESLIIEKQIDDILDEELLFFSVILPQTEIPFAVQEKIEPLRQISGFNVWKLKREKQQDFTYRIENEKMKLMQGNQEYFAQGFFKKCLERERFIIDDGGLFYREDVSGLEAIDLSIPDSVKNAYAQLVNYYKERELLPSLAYFDCSYKQVAENYVRVFLDELMKLDHGQSLAQQQRNLACLGTIERVIKDKEWLFTPLHPLNIAYQLQLNDLVGEQALGDEMLKTMRSTHLLPYITYDINQVYKPIEQADAPEWAIYVDQLLTRYEGTRSFVKKLVQEKIEEFTEHFGYLFDLDRRAPLKINVINMGDCREVLQGVFEYYKKQLRSKKVTKSDLLPVEIYIYADEGIGNVFEDFSHYTDVNEIASHFDLKLQDEEYLPEEILTLFREKVHFYSKHVNSETYEYSHVTFYQMSKIETNATSNMAEILTGVSLFGLSSGVPSVFINGDYKTGFGMKYYPQQENALLQLVPRLNALLRVARTRDNFHADASIVTAISETNKQGLDRVYDSSHWVTFVEPRVDLSFFKNNAAQKDLLVIHYSDQYTSSSGFDAITVTRRSRQYQQLIEEFLNSHQIDVRTETSSKIINLFNAINGNWLLRLLAQKNHFSKEKISILSAVKLALACFHHSNIIWIPISMEEVLRISGGTGLKQTEGLFSAKNLGRFDSYSDDLLMIGIEKVENQLLVHLYPVEVKIGQNPSAVKEKATKQVKRTRELLREFLQDDETFRAKIYRNFFMQLAIVSAERMKLYEIWPEQSWDEIIDHETRRQLLNDEYEIIDDLQPMIGEGAIISFQREVFFTNVTKSEEVIVIDCPEKNGYNYIVENVEQLKQRIQQGNSDIPPDHLLSHLYQPTDLLHETRLEQADAPIHVPAMGPTIEPEVHVFQEELIIFHEPQGNDEVLTQVEQLPQPVVVQTIARKPMEVLFGHSVQNGEEVKWYPTSTDKVMHTNTGIIGTMGTGKTQFTKSLVTQLHRNGVDNVYGTPIGILVFDYKGDYIKPDFVEATGAKIYSLYHLPFNPLSLYVTQPPKPLLPVHTSSNLTETISTAFNLGAVQTSTLKDLIMEAYEIHGIHKANVDTWTKPAPTMSDLYDLFAERDGVKIDSLYAALKELYDYEVFEPDAAKTIPLFDMIDGITVINLSGYSESIQNLVVAITLDVFYNQMQMVGHSQIDGNMREITRMILVDEADNFLSKDFKSIKKILKEGREFGVGTILSTQFLSHFSTANNDYANYILTWIVHNVAELSAKDIKMIFNTQTKSEEENILNRVKALQKHYSIVKGVGNQPIWMRDKAFWEL